MSREKQIEEMAKVMNECCNRYDEQGNHIGNKCYECEEWSDDNHCCCSYNRKEAEALYNAGYRKQSEGGEWKGNGYLKHCSECGNCVNFNNVSSWLYNFCPHCGAKMKGGAE